MHRLSFATEARYMKQKPHGIMFQVPVVLERWERVPLRSYIRIYLIAIVVLGVNACTQGAEEPRPTPVSSAVITPKTEHIASPAPPLKTPPITSVVPPVSSPVRTQSKPAVPAQTTSTLDWMALEKQLKSTKSIGVFSKIALKNQVDDLLKKFRDHYKGKKITTMAELHRSFDLLMMKVLSLIQDDDQKLASAIVSSRDAIWALLADPKQFSALEL